jgi:hypothetical protein
MATSLPGLVLVAVGLGLGVGPPPAVALGVGLGVSAPVAATVKPWITAAAGWNSAFPPCEAWMSHWPAAKVVTVEPVTEHTCGVCDANDTGSPDEAEAETVKLTPTAWEASGEKDTTWGSRVLLLLSVVADASGEAGLCPLRYTAVTSK